jgi:flagellar hook-associated protein 3 FlgL
MIDLTNQMSYRIGSLDVQNQKISYQMSTGKKLENGSDDAVLYGKVVNIETNLRTYEGLKTQIEKTTAQNTVADGAVDEVKKVLDTIKVDLLKSLNSGMTRPDRVAVAKNVEGMRENLLSLMNTQVDDEFIFSGSNTTVPTYEKDADFKINGQVDFKGNSHLRNIAVEPNVYRERGITATDVMMYNTDTTAVDETISFTQRETVVDEYGNTWKLADIDIDNADGDDDITTGTDGVKLFKYKEDGSLSKYADSAGVLHPEYLDVTATAVPGGQTIYTSETLSDANAANPKHISDKTASGLLLEAKHNVFDDLNIMINALYGYSTKQTDDPTTNGQKDAVIDDESVRQILSNTLELMSNQFDATNIAHAELGGRNRIFESSLERVNSKVTHYNILMQETNGADMAKLAMESKSLELTYNALYSTVSKMNQLSLVNFLK